MEKQSTLRFFQVAPPLTHPRPLASPFEDNPMLASQRMQLPAASSAPTSEEGPSLVTQLQQVCFSHRKLSAIDLKHLLDAWINEKKGLRLEA